jgi:hypothetical protein
MPSIVEHDRLSAARETDALILATWRSTLILAPFWASFLTSSVYVHALSDLSKRVGCAGTSHKLRFWAMREPQLL